MSLTNTCEKVRAEKLFDLGEIFITPGARDEFATTGESPSAFLRRHQTGDWGACCPDDRAANDAAVASGARIFTAFLLASGVKIWIITDGDDDDRIRHSTTILLPDEY